MAGQKETPEDCYEIRLQECLDDCWASWFEGMELTKEPEGETCLFGKLPDQAALLGVLRKVQEIGLTLLSVRRCRRGAKASPSSK
ncbi:MAG TPA: hypothetical protein VKK31_20730 [Thermoanaerobaculia bacterium]|nr:hypothetical protein [Thermoanaerobaculia bacterium]